MQALFSPEIENDVTKNNFPVFVQGKNRISLADVLQVSKDLLDGLFTRLTLDVQAEYRFAGA